MYIHYYFFSLSLFLFCLFLFLLLLLLTKLADQSNLAVLRPDTYYRVSSHYVANNKRHSVFRFDVKQSANPYLKIKS